jgi:secreted PhoX family phosphatase
VTPVPLKAMGRFLHEAACIDPRTGIAYLTEDRGDSLLYRFIPHQPGELAKGGRLQALVVQEQSQFDSRNWDKARWSVGDALAVEWVDIENPESPEDDLRLQGYQKGAALFARGEGIHWGQEALYFCCTNGGAKQLGQIMRYRPSPFEGTAQESQKPGQLALFVESQSPVSYNFGDNVAVAPNGHLIVCEDQYTDVVDNHLRGVTPAGELYTLARLRLQTELAGACFSPDGSVLFVNIYSPSMTLAIYKDGETKDANSIIL